MDFEVPGFRYKDPGSVLNIYLNVYFIRKHYDNLLYLHFTKARGYELTRTQALRNLGTFTPESIYKNKYLHRTPKPDANLL